MENPVLSDTPEGDPDRLGWRVDDVYTGGAFHCRGRLACRPAAVVTERRFECTWHWAVLSADGTVRERGVVAYPGAASPRVMETRRVRAHAQARRAAESAMTF